MRPTKLTATIGLLAVIISGQAHADGTRDCTSSNMFDPPKWPVFELEKYAHGQLGIVKATYDHFYLFMAYRVLNGLGFRDEDLAHLRESDPCWRPDGAGRGQYRYSYEYGFGDKILEKLTIAENAWISTRQKIEGFESTPAKLDAFHRGNSTYAWAEFLNCNPDAFLTAAATLEARLAAHGQGETVKDWVRAQDHVFYNCSSPTGPLDDVPESAPAWLKHDRQYQRAAADFYAGRYEEAWSRFDQIAAAPDSPWRSIAPYMAARSLTRSAGTTSDDKFDTAKLANAQNRLITMLSTPLNPELRSNVVRQLQFIQLRLDPDAVRLDMEKRFQEKVLPESVGQDITDFWYAYEKSGGADAAEDSFSLWLSSLRGYHEPQYAYDLWKKTQKLPWLVASMMLATQDSENLDKLKSAARKITIDSPAYPTLQYHLIRLDPDGDSALRTAKSLITQDRQRLSPQDINHAKNQVLAYTRTLDDFVWIAKREVTYPATPGLHVTIDLDAQRMLNAAIPINTLNKLRSNPGLSPVVQENLAVAIWTRAFVLRRWDMLKELSNHIKKIQPQLAPEVDKVLTLRDKNAQYAYMAMLFLRNPGFVGNIEKYYLGQKNFGEFGWNGNWWCGFPNRRYFEDGAELKQPPAGFLSAAEKTMLKTEREILDNTPDATSFLGNIVMDWAEAHPRDPGLPQTLHMLVRATRGGCVEDRSLSQRAFLHLHRYFPKNAWALKTRVHY